MNRIAFPFLVLSDSSVSFSSWMIGLPNEPLVEAQEVLENWDYEQDLQVNVHLVVDFLAAANQLQIDVNDLRLAAMISAGTGSGNLSRRVDRLEVELLDKNKTEVVFDVVIPGKNLSGQLLLGIQIVLDSPLRSGNELSPKYRGARLWQTQKRILIEDGGDSRFPVEMASFSDSFDGRPEQYSPWFVDWSPASFDADFSGNIRLYVNSDNIEVSKRLVEGDPLTLQSMVSDVMTQMIECALDSEEFSEMEHYSEGSIGGQIRMWIDNIFQLQNLDNIRRMRKYKPGQFRAAILASADFGGNS